MVPPVHFFIIIIEFLVVAVLSPYLKEIHKQKIVDAAVFGRIK